MFFIIIGALRFSGGISALHKELIKLTMMQEWPLVRFTYKSKKIPF